MLNFNLLPPERKKEIKLEKINLSVDRLLRVFLLFFIIFLTLLLTIYLYLDILLAAQKESLELRKGSPIYKEALSLDQEIEKANLRANRIFTLQQGFKYLSPIIEKIANLISGIEGVYLYNLTLSQESEKISPEPQKPEGETPEELPGGEEKIQEEPKVIEKKYWGVAISGFAPKREQVLLIENALRRDPDFYDIVSPIENIISPTKINFTFTFKIKE